MTLFTFVLGNRVILATIIVGVALMMLFSAIMPAMAQPGLDRPATGPGSCADLAAKLLVAGLDPDKVFEILTRMGCSP